MNVKNWFYAGNNLFMVHCNEQSYVLFGFDCICSLGFVILVFKMKILLTLIFFCPSLMLTQRRRNLDCTCGERIESVVVNRVFGGTKAAPNEFPWQAFLKIYSELGAFVCGGTLINDRYLRMEISFSFDIISFFL